MYTIGLCIGQVFSIRYDTIRSAAISDILDENFLQTFSMKKIKSVGEQSWYTCIRHMRGTFGWLGDKFIKSLVMDSDISIPPDVATRKNTNDIRQHRTLSSQNTLKICSLSVRGYFWILNFDSAIKSAIFKPDVILAYRQNNVLYIAWQTYTGMYRYINILIHP